MLDTGPISRARAYGVLGIFLLSAAVVATLAENRRPAPPGEGLLPPSAGAQRGTPAKSYAELRESSRGPSLEVYLASAGSLRAMLPAVTDPVQREPGAEQAMRIARAARRAFEGAPPTVPHPVDARALPNCSVCHERGAMIADRIAPMMSHAKFSSCVQCHVEERAAAPTPPFDERGEAPNNSAQEHRADGAQEGWGGTLQFARSAVNGFQPLALAGVGTRAWEGAPPTVPHTTWMRERCASCHGVAGKEGLRTSHPARQNCEQCHATDANLNLLVARFGQP